MSKTNLKMVLLLLGGVAVLSLTGCNHFLYPGDRFPHLLPVQISPQPIDLKIPVLGGSQNESLHAWKFSNTQKEKKGVVVHFHGNGQNLTTHFLYFKWLIDYGYDVLIFDYRGYGSSSGEKATQQKTVEDGLSVFNYVNKNFSGQPVIAIGQSIGTAALARTLQELKKSNPSLLPQFVVFDSSFISYRAAARSVLSQRWFLYPGKLFTYFVIDDDWSPRASLQHQPAIPALFFHNEGDPMINLDLGQKAFDAWVGPKHLIVDKLGGHTSAFGDPRFAKNKETLVRCLDFVVNQKQNLGECIK